MAPTVPKDSSRYGAPKRISLNGIVGNLPSPVPWLRGNLPKTRLHRQNGTVSSGSTEITSGQPVHPREIPGTIYRSFPADHLPFPACHSSYA
jgi:hypothetical protein